MAATNFRKFINKRLSRTTKLLHAWRVNIADRIIIILSYIHSFFAGAQKKTISVQNLKTKSDRDIVINCLGCTDLKGNVESYNKDIRAVRTMLVGADICFTSSRFGKQSTEKYKALYKQLSKHHITDLAYENKLLSSKIYRTAVGNVGVCACMMNFRSASKRRIRLRLIQEYYLLKRMGAEYVIIYLDSKQQKTVTEKNKRLCELLLKAGVDYVVNVKPLILDSGVTYRQKNGTVSRAVYSVGTFLSDRKSFPEDRVAIRIKLRKVNGKLQAFEEAYYPLRYNRTKNLKLLGHTNKEIRKDDVAVLAKIEKSMPRLRSVSRILTVGKVMELIGTELPKNLQYLESFSVGKVRARSFEVVPGDIFFFREPFADPNDLTVQTPKQQLRIAKVAAKRGSVLQISYQKLGSICKYVLCDNVKEAHIAVCAYLRGQLNMKTVGITGSIGKTSTKDMLAEVMKMKYNTVKSENNTNVQVAIGENIQKLDSSCEVFIQEMGGGRPGGASRHACMVLPEVTVVTNIGDAHLGNFFGDQHALMQNKLGIIEGMPENGVLYLNMDDPLLAKAEPDCKTVFFAVHNQEADYYADNIDVEGNKTYFDVVYGNQRVRACVNVPGEHNVLNAICSFAIGRQFGIPEQTIVQGIANFKTQGIRQNIVQACGVKMFLDCFNASSGSVESSIKTFAQMEVPEGGKRVALIGDITGLGDMAESTHKEIATPLIENPADVFIFYGKNTKYTYELVKAQGLCAYYTPKNDVLYQMISTIVRPGDIVMAKGSSKMMLEYALDCVYGTRFFDSILIDDNAYYRVGIRKVSYNLFGTHATAVKTRRGSKLVRVKGRVGAVPVYNISSSFSSPTIVNVELPDTIRHIGVNAFNNSKKLESVVGATKLKYIGTAAFKNCVSLKTISLPQTLMHIGNEAFMGCAALRELYIPESVVQIGPNAFKDCPNLKITCKAGSYAQVYLEKNKIPYKCV